MKKSDKRNLIIGVILFYSVCFGGIILFANLRSKDAISTFENNIKNSDIIREKYGNIKKIKFKNLFNYGKSVNNEYVMKVKITNDKNKTYIIDVISGKSTNSIVGFIIDGKRYDEYESFNLENYQNKINNNKLEDVKIVKFTNYQELFDKIKELAIELYGEDDYLAYKIYYDKNNLTYLVEVYTKEKQINFFIKENGEVLSSFIVE